MLALGSFMDGSLGRRGLLSGCNSRRVQRSYSNRQQVVVRAGSEERRPWEFGRFLSTLAYFNPPDAVLRSVFSRMTGQGGAAAAAGEQGAVLTLLPPPPDAAQQPVVMVTGATGGVGRRVVARLLQRGARVRALVRDVGKARGMLAGLPAGGGASLELVAADITQRATLLPHMFAGVRQLVCCTAVKVAPKEGDTQDRSKYYQGIKFFDPEVVGDTPEAVELGGMRNVLEAAREGLGLAGGRVLWAPDGSGALPGWGSLDDVVMGGASSSGFFVQQGAGEAGGPAGVFSGTTTTANNGGFASVRTRNAEPPLDLGAYEGLELRLKGDGQRYKLILRCSPGWDTVGYTASFPTQPGWQTVRLPFRDLAPVFRARTQRGMAPFNPASVYSVQLMLSKFESDGALNPTFREGAFELPVERISAYLAEPVVPRFVLVSSAGVTRPNRPGINVEEEPPAVRMNDMLGGILTYKLAAEDALRASGIPFAVVRPVALTEEPEGMPLRLEQGDTLRGKVSREDVSELCIQLLSQPAAANCTFEVGSSVPFSQPWTVDTANPPAPRDWTALVEGAALKQGVTGKTVGGVYTGREPEPDVSVKQGAVNA